MSVQCPYCGADANLVRGDVVYPHRPDLHDLKFWTCDPCFAWVGTHRGTDEPLGRLANAELRKAKIAAHAAFDPLWRRKMQRDGCSKGKARRAGYTWLAGQLGIEFNDCHIGMFDVSMCERVVDLCGRRLRAST